MTFTLRLENKTFKPCKFKLSSICCQSDPKIDQKKRLTTISKDKYSFKGTNEHYQYYQVALIKGGLNHELVYIDEKSNSSKRKRKYSELYPTFL